MRGNKFLKKGFALALALAMVVQNNSYYTSSTFKAEEIIEEATNVEEVEIPVDEIPVEEEPIEEIEEVVEEEIVEEEITEEANYVPADEDPTFIRVTKSISGLTDAEITALNNSGFVIRVTKDGESCDLKLNDEDASRSGNTFTWTINGLEAGTYTVTEEKAEVDGYNLNTTGTGTVTTKASKMTAVMTKRETNCNHTNWNIGVQNVIYAKLTSNTGYFVWTPTKLSANQRNVIYDLINGTNGMSGADVTNTHFFSGDISDKLEYRGGISYDGVDKLVFHDTDQWSMFAYGIATMSEAENAEIEIGNSYKPITTTVTGNKVWVDNNNANKVRPTSITVNVKDGRTTVDTINLSAGEDGIWQDEELNFTSKELPKYRNGQEINYTVEEVAVPGYTTTYNGNTITNTLNDVVDVLTPIALTINKVDANTKNSLIGAVFTATNRTDTIQSVENNGVYTITFTKDGTYTVKETTAPTGYTLNTNEYTVVVEKGTVKSVTLNNQGVWEKLWTLVFGSESQLDKNNQLTVEDTPTTVTYTVNKVWSDNNNQDGLRDKYTVQLYADGTAYGDAVELDAATLTYTWKNLPSTKDGKEVEYTVNETNVPDGYTKSVDGNTITNTHIPEQTTVKGNKVWVDDNNVNGVRPTSITVNVKDGNDTKDTIILSAGDDGIWQAEELNFESKELPKYRNGQVINYTVEEVAVPGYTTTIKGNEIINTLNDVVDVVKPATLTINKVDDNGDIITTGEAVFTLTKEDGTSTDYTTTNGVVEIKFENGSQGTYTLSEKTAPAGYTKTNDTWTVEVKKEFVEVKLNGSIWQSIYNMIFGSKTQNALITVQNHKEAIMSSVDVDLVAKKTVNGSTPKSDETFSFTLTEVDETGNALDPGYTDTKTNDANGDVKFDRLTFSNEGTYTYTVKENETGTAVVPGYVLDETSHTVVIEVTPDGTSLKADVKVDGNAYDSKNTSITFNNTYSKQSLDGNGIITGTKKYTDKEWTDEEFAFNLSIGDYVGTATVNAASPEDEDGNKVFAFDEITYKVSSDRKSIEAFVGDRNIASVGMNRGEAVFTYKVSEVIPNITNGIEYDQKSYDVKVKVTNSPDKKYLEVSKVDKDLSVVFENKYTASSSIDISATKKFEGGTLEDKQFTFTLTEVNEQREPLQYTDTAKNDATGKVTFKTIDYTEPGIHYYLISEEKTIENIQYADDQLITVTVIDENGELSAKADKTTIEFVNRYQPSKAYIKFDGKKKLDGKAWAEIDKEDKAKLAGNTTFTISILNKDTNKYEEIDSATLDANGSFEFFKQMGAVEFMVGYGETQEYTFKVVETKTANGYNIDSKDHVYKVKVVDQKNGKAIVNVNGVEGSELTITTTFNNTKGPHTGVGVNLLTYLLLSDVSLGGLVALVNKKRKSSKK